MPLTTIGPDWRDGFVFVGDQLAIDFANTRLAAGGKPIDLLTDWRAVVRWYHAVELMDRPTARRLEGKMVDARESRRALDQLTAFRDDLRTAIAEMVARGAPRRSFIVELNRHLDTGAVRSQLKLAGRRVVREWKFQPAGPEDLIGPIADAAARLFVDGDRTRIRRCDGCVAYFYDRSKNGLRRWCSMRMCGNRAKVARFAARHRRP